MGLAMIMFSRVRKKVSGAGNLPWLFVATVVAVVLATGGWRVGAGVVPVAFDAEDRLAEFRQISVGEILTGGPSALEDLDRQVSEVHADVQPASRTMRWVGRFAPALSWAPIVRQEVHSWVDQLERVEYDIAAASALLDSSSLLLDAYSDAQTALVNTEAGQPITLLRDRFREMEESYAVGLSAIEDAKRGARSLSIVLEGPRLRGLTGDLKVLERRIQEASDVGWRASGLLGDLLELADDAQSLMAQFSSSGSESEPWTTDLFKAALARMNDNTESASLKLDLLADLIAQTGQADGLLPELDSVDQLLAVLRAVTRASLVGLSAIEPATGAVEGSGLLNKTGGLIEVLNGFDERRGELAEAVARLETAQRILDEMADGGEGLSVTSRLSEISEFVTDLHVGLRLVGDIAPLRRSLLGADGVQRYLVLGQSADELRATGGFVSSVWLVTFENGALTDIDYEDSVRVDDWERLELYPKAPPGLDEHMNAWVWLMRDVSWDPDFPTTAATAGDMYAIGLRQEVDGVVAINQWTLLSLVEALGSIPSPDGDAPVTSRNLLPVLEEGTDLHGRAYMDLVLQGVLDRLNEPMSVPTLIRLASALNDTLKKRDTLVFFKNPDLQSVASESGWDGAVRQESTDYLYVVDSNVGWSKVDRNIQRDISYVVDLRKEPRPRVSLSLRYANHSGPGSPNCHPQWLNRGTDYSRLKNACYWNFLRVYFPQGSRLLSSTPLTLSEDSVSVEIGRGVPGQDTGAISSVHEKMVFSGLTSLEAGERGEINLVYDLPVSAVRRDGTNIVYELLIQKQPGVRQREVSVEFIVPEGYSPTASSVPIVRLGDARFGLGLTLQEDTTVRVEFDKDAYGSN